MKTLICDDEGYIYRIALPPEATVEPDGSVRIPCDPPLPLIGDEYLLSDFFLIEAATHKSVPGLEMLQKSPKGDLPIHEADAKAGRSQVKLLAVVAGARHEVEHSGQGCP